MHLGLRSLWLAFAGGRPAVLRLALVDGFFRAEIRITIAAPAAEGQVGWAKGPSASAGVVEFATCVMPAPDMQIAPAWQGPSACARGHGQESAAGGGGMRQTPVWPGVRACSPRGCGLHVACASFQSHGV